jgi:hypothetical protein
MVDNRDKQEMIGREIMDVTLVTQSRVPLYGMHQT